MDQGGSASKAIGWGLVVGGILIAAVVVALYSPTLGVFDIRNLRVLGNETVPTVQVAELVGVKAGENLLRLSLSRIESLLLKDPRIQNATVRRSLPHTLVVQVEERRPIAGCSHPLGGWCLVGDDAVILGTSDELPEGLVVIAGVSWDGDPAPGAKAMDAWTAFAMALISDANSAGAEIQSVDFSDPTCVIATRRRGTTIALGEPDQLESSFRALMSLLDEVDADDYQSIDLSRGGEATLVPREVVNR
ncbi:FtsQ-type POTRA domain-containing protein [Candidatus Bipolaricaulota bacterium]|nr:FtsQ-type POTRA domain-containing protein [Candidatus Bipolaricaulota bacterium]